MPAYPGPSILSRHQWATQAADRLDAYLTAIVEEPGHPEQVQRLLAALAAAEVALHFETGGRLGNEFANTLSVHDRLRNGPAEPVPIDVQTRQGRDGPG